MIEHPHIELARRSHAIAEANPEKFVVAVAVCMTPLRRAAFGDYSDDPRLEGPAMFSDLRAAEAAEKRWNDGVAKQSPNLWAMAMSIESWSAEFYELLDLSIVEAEDA